MKNLKRYLSIFLLLIAFSCQTDHFETEPRIPELKASYVRPSDAQDVMDKLNNSLNPTPVGGAANSGKVNTSAGKIDISQILEVVDTLSNTNYTFLVDDEDGNPFTFTNLVIKKREDGSIDSPYLLDYELDSAFIPEFIASGFNMANFTGRTVKRYLDNFSTGGKSSANLEKRGEFTPSTNECDRPTDYVGGTGGSNGGALSGQPAGGYPSGGGTITACYEVIVAVEGPECEMKDSRLTLGTTPSFTQGCDYIIYPGQSSRTTSTIYLRSWKCVQVTRSSEANDDSMCPEPETESVGIVNLAFYEYLDSIAESLPQEIFGLDPELVWQYMWQNGYVNPYGAGFLDGIRETLGSIYGMTTFFAAWNKYDPFNTYYYSAEASFIRQQTVGIMELLKDLIYDSTIRNEFWTGLKTEFGNYVDVTASLTPQGMYNQGKLIFDVAGLFIGISEINAIVKGQKITRVLLNSLKAMPKGMAAALVSAKKLGLKTIKQGDEIIIKSQNGLIDIAKIKGTILEFNYSGFGGKIVTNPNKTTTIIGKWENQIENMWNTGLAKQGQNTGGMNILGVVPNGTVLEKWNFNKQWLDEAISRGDVIRASADPLHMGNVFHITSGIPQSAFQSTGSLKNYMLSMSATTVEQLGYYGREIRHLFQNGYSFDNIAKQFIK